MGRCRSCVKLRGDLEPLDVVNNEHSGCCLRIPVRRMRSSTLLLSMLGQWVAEASLSIADRPTRLAWTIVAAQQAMVRMDYCQTRVIRTKVCKLYLTSLGKLILNAGSAVKGRHLAGHVMSKAGRVSDGY